MRASTITMPMPALKRAEWRKTDIQDNAAKDSDAGMVKPRKTLNIQKMIESGAAEYIMKPFTPDILLEKISQIIGE